jgi:hypothetical protein
MHERRVFVRVHLDANRINSRQRLNAVNQLEAWHDNEIIELFMSKTAHDEARDGGDSRRAGKALGYIYSLSVATTQEEKSRIREIESILAEEQDLDPNTKRDAEIVFNAGKYSAILATADQRILRHRDELWNRLRIRVMTAEDVVLHVRNKITQRDDVEKRLNELQGSPLPDWVGHD